MSKGKVLPMNGQQLVNCKDHGLQKTVPACPRCIASMTIKLDKTLQSYAELEKHLEGVPAVLNKAAEESTRLQHEITELKAELSFLKKKYGEPEDQTEIDFAPTVDQKHSA